MTLKLWQWLLVACLLTSCVAFCTAAAVNNPTPHGQLHKTQSDYWDSIRLRPVKVLSIEGATINYQFDDTETLILGSVETDDITKLPKGFKENERYILIFCDTHKVAYEFVPLPR